MTNDERRIMILRIVKKAGCISRYDLFGRTGIAYVAMMPILKHLESEGLVSVSSTEEIEYTGK